MTGFIPAQPVITPAPAATPALAPPTAAPAAGVAIVGTPSKSPPPHINQPKLAPTKPVVREYAWQRAKALGKRF